MASLSFQSLSFHLFNSVLHQEAFTTAIPTRWGTLKILISVFKSFFFKRQFYHEALGKSWKQTVKFLMCYVNCFILTFSVLRREEWRTGRGENSPRCLSRFTKRWLSFQVRSIQSSWLFFNVNIVCYIHLQLLLTVSSWEGLSGDFIYSCLCVWGENQNFIIYIGKQLYFLQYVIIFHSLW